MPIVVQKYGGSSVADVGGIHAVAQRVVQTVQAGHRVVVVVSAMGNTTNELLALARSVSAQPGRRELDLLVSVGERVSMTLLAMAIQDLGVPAASFTGSQSGIITDENHVAAQVLEVRPWRIEKALKAGKVAIVAGFQGVSRANDVTTLGRGGSDTTAVVLTAALGAAYCELCSDVDGVYTADPRVVAGAQRIQRLPLDAAAALAQAGSKVVQAQAVAQARKWGVTLVASATTDPVGSGTHMPPGTAPGAPVGVASDDQLERIWLPTGAQLDGVAGAVRAAWAQDGGTTLLLDLRDLHDRASLDLPPGARSMGAAATVSAVGRSLVTDPQAGAALLAALAPMGVTHWWAMGDTWTALVEVDRCAEALRALHETALS